jgi:hypothetical protein
MKLKKYWKRFWKSRRDVRKRGWAYHIFMIYISIAFSHLIWGSFSFFWLLTYLSFYFVLSYKFRKIKL